MNDLLRTGIGGERGDQTLKASNAARPLWSLVPLPLSQVNPSAVAPTAIRGRAKSLQHSCLTTISREFHQYTPASFEGLPSQLLQRILHRVKLDRRYETSGQDIALRPDAATIWAFSLLADPEAVDTSHTVALPVDVTLAHLKPQPTLAKPLHPLVEIPILYRTMHRNSRFELITTLQLDGLNDAVNDHTVMPLRWATQLTVLKMTGCKRLTDAGIRLLASALELPGRYEDEEGKGMWRLRAWYLDGCTEISDRSMSLFARWPGLVLLDVRNTSCTTSGIDVYNRNNESLYTGQLAVMQQCSSGLSQLFARRSPPSALVDRLARTILAPNASRQPLAYRSLSIIPSHGMPPAEYLPDPTPLSANGAKYDSARKQGANYVMGGVGQIYGGGVDRMVDEGREFRRDVSTALYMQAIDDGLCSPPKREPLYPKKRKGREWESSKKDPKTWLVHQAGKAYKLKKGEMDDRSKRFAAGVGTGGGLRMDGEVENVKLEQGVMMVRVAQEGWDRLSWSLAKRPAAAVVPTQKPKVDIIAELLSMSQPTATAPAPAASGKAATPVSQMFRAGTRTTAQMQITSNVFATSSQGSQSSQGSIRFNPFSQAGTLGTRFGVKPLSSSPSSEMQVLCPDTCGDGFASSGKKRSWGIGAEGEGRRTGMKMFSGKRM